MEISRTEKYMSQIKIVLDGFNCNVGTTEERISRVKVRSIETLQMEENAMVL